jgi:hypothetical protein
MNTREDTEMRPVWSWALSWFRMAPSDTGRRLRQAALVARLKAELATVENVPGLHERYHEASRWTVPLAREHFPQEWPLLGIHACTAAAFALRYVEIVTGQRLQVVSLPRWLGEWTIP